MAWDDIQSADSNITYEEWNAMVVVIDANTAKNSYPTADATKVGFISVTQAVDLDTIETDVGLNTTHRTSSGVDHTYIDQSITTTADVVFNSVSVAAGQKINLEGAGGDTYFIFTGGKVELWVNGAKKADWS